MRRYSEVVKANVRAPLPQEGGKSLRILETLTIL